MTIRQPWAAVLAASPAAFGLLAVAVAAHGWAPFGFEQAAVDWCVAHRPAAAETVAKIVTALGTGVFPYLLALTAGVALAAARRHTSVWTAAAALLGPAVCLATGQLARLALMHSFGRPRPPVSDWATSASGFAFPSGHAFTSALAAGLLAFAATRAYRVPPRTTAALAAAFTAAVGLSRIYLGVHWPLDVLAGWLLATAWLTLTGALLGARATPRSQRPTPV
ncbi:phosphatase PAP2 family protein [Kitasatospora sp. NPDC049285]|uniref:phosphatase PAP2 family protein n=1 Tax=Kitasatospora sp. NPDC049285 TaxID=3157096 RepID=UPI00343ECDAC